jgi:hypothetical protein
MRSLALSRSRETRPCTGGRTSSGSKHRRDHDAQASNLRDTVCKCLSAVRQKAERKGRTKEEVNQIICWLTGYDQAGLRQQIERKSDFETFFAQAPAIHPNSSLIKGVVCGVRVEEIEGSADAKNTLFRQAD